MAQFGNEQFGFFVGGGVGVGGSPYGFFYDSVTQNSTPINTAIKVLIRQTQQSAGGVSLSNSKISVTESGVYSVVTTFQFENTSGGTHSASAWLQKGNDGGASSIFDNSNFIWQLTNGQHIVGVLNNALTLAINDYIEIYFSTTNAGLSIVATPTQSTPTRPATPSVTLLINKIS